MNKNFKLISFSLLGIGLLLILLVVFGVFKEKEYKITFDSNGGSMVSNQVVKENNLVNKPSNPIREGYDFLYWELNNQEYHFNEKVVSDITLIAKWQEVIKKYDITFNVDGVSKTVNVSSLMEIDYNSLGYEEKEGYELKWYLNDVEVDKAMALIEPLNITGKYVKTVTYTVKFNSNGGSKVNNQVVKANNMVAEPTNVTKTGFILEGWYLNNQRYDFSSPVTKGITLTAKWVDDPNVKRYTVTFDSKGGSKVGEKKVIDGQTVSAPNNPTKTGSIFDGWYLNDKKYDFKTKVSSDITLEAKWRNPYKYTVTFDSDNGTGNVSQTVLEGEKVSKPSNPSKSGYTFKEWQLNNKAYNFNTVVTGDITLKAVYTKNEETQHDTYEVVATRVDSYSPDSRLKVLKNGTQISVREIRFTDGVSLCNGSNMVVGTSDISGISTLLVILNDGSSVRATLR